MYNCYTRLVLWTQGPGKKYQFTGATVKYRAHLKMVPIYKKISKFHGCQAPVAPVLTRLLEPLHCTNSIEDAGIQNSLKENILYSKFIVCNTYLDMSLMIQLHTNFILTISTELKMSLEILGKLGLYARFFHSFILIQVFLLPFLND